MHPAIGQLLNGKFYCYINGYSAEPFVGTLDEVGVAMGLRAAPEASSTAAVQSAPIQKTYTVTLTFQYPAWDELDGITYPGIQADSKAEANMTARRLAEVDGHLGSGKGRATFRATEQ